MKSIPFMIKQPRIRENIFKYCIDLSCINNYLQSDPIHVTLMDWFVCDHLHCVNPALSALPKRGEGTEPVDKDTTWTIRASVNRLVLRRFEDSYVVITAGCDVLKYQHCGFSVIRKGDNLALFFSTGRQDLCLSHANWILSILPA